MRVVQRQLQDALVECDGVREVVSDDTNVVKHFRARH